MRTFIISDIHGQYDAYMKMLEKIDFSEEDTLYVLGDILDRGPRPISIVLDLMDRPNVVCLAGNHEYMALACLRFLMKEVTEENLEQLDPDIVLDILNWQHNGSDTTLAEFRKLDKEQQEAVVSFMEDFELYEEIHMNGKDYILVHAGLGNFRRNKKLWEYSIEELVWERPNYGKAYFSDKYVIAGHTPTQVIKSNPNPGYIFHKNNHIVIDCGAGFGERLACLCLDTMEEFYVECKDSLS